MECYLKQRISTTEIAFMRATSIYSSPSQFLQSLFLSEVSYNELFISTYAQIHYLIQIF